MPLSAATQQSQPRLARAALLCLAMLCVSATVGAQPVGNVVYVQGIASAQKPGESARFVQKRSHRGCQRRVRPPIARL